MHEKGVILRERIRYGFKEKRRERTEGEGGKIDRICSRVDE